MNLYLVLFSLTNSVAYSIYEKDCVVSEPSGYISPVGYFCHSAVPTNHGLSLHFCP